jgi:MFS family permease
MGSCSSLFQRLGSIFDEYKGIPREANLLIYSSFFTWAAAGLFFISLQVFLLLEGVSFGTSSLILGTFGIVSASSTLLFGGLADRYGKKQFIVTGGILSSLSLAIFALDTNISHLFGAAVLAGLSEASFASSWSALLADKAGNLKRTSAFGLSFFVATIAAALGGFSTILLDLMRSLYGIDLIQGNRYLFVSVAAISLIGPLIVYLKVSESKLQPSRESGFRILPRRARGVVFRYALAGIIIALGAGMVIPLVPGWAFLKFGLANDVTGPIFGGINSLVMGFANLATPRLARRFGTVRTIVLTQGTSTVFLFSMPFSPNFAAASSIYVVRSMLMMMSNPAQNSLLMGLVPVEERAVASAITAALWRLPNSFSTGIGGYIMGLATASNGVTNPDSIYLALPFLICTGLYLTSISYFWRSFKDVKLPEEQVQAVAAEAVPAAT